MAEVDKYVNRVLDEIYLIKKGVRDCALVDLGLSTDKWAIIQYNVEQAVIQNDLNIIFKSFETDDPDGINTYYEAYIYKYNHQRLIIDLLDTLPTHELLYEYILGNLLGYSGAAMEEHIMKKVISSAADEIKKHTVKNDNCMQSNMKKIRKSYGVCNIE